MADNLDFPASNIAPYHRSPQFNWVPMPSRLPSPKFRPSRLPMSRRFSSEMFCRPSMLPFLSLSLMPLTDDVTVTAPAMPVDGILHGMMRFGGD